MRLLKHHVDYAAKSTSHGFMVDVTKYLTFT